MNFDFKNPDYTTVFNNRIKMLNYMRSNKSKIPQLKEYYKYNIAQFITDFGLTFDPRNPEKGLPSVIPFILFDKQIDWVDWLLKKWKGQEPGITEKTRDMGMSWLAIAVSCSICLFYPDVVIGFGSRKEEYVDKIGNLKALLPKARFFLQNLPREFTDGWNSKNSTFKLINFNNGSQIIGEAGDGIGRGARSSIYLLDESAFIERPKLVDASLSQTTNCRIDISTPNGLGNTFAEKRHSGKIDIFTFHWRDDPRKDKAWYQKQKYELDPVTVAQELDINYSASVEGVVIPNEWIQAAIDAHIVLNIKPTGINKLSWDVADEGADKNAIVHRKGCLVDYVKIWSGVNGDIMNSTIKAFAECDNFNATWLDYDADGLGASVRGDARTLNELRFAKANIINVNPFRGSGAVFRPNDEMMQGKKNEDAFYNAKAQAWWQLRLRFQETYRAVVEKHSDYNPELIISLSSKMQSLIPLVMELSQPTYKFSENGKMLINKKPDGTKSPNMADAIMICFAPQTQDSEIINPKAYEAMLTW